MLTLYILGHTFHYELENLCRLFFPDEKLVRKNELPPEPGGDHILTRVSREGPGTLLLEAGLQIGGARLFDAARQSLEGEPDAESERALAVLLFGLLAAHCGLRPKWGILTGVRPAKLMGTLLRTHGEAAAAEYFTEKLLVSPGKTRLAMEAAKAAEIAALGLSPRSFSLYISVPFCPTRCAYCSFISHSAPAALRLLPDYTEKLCEEIRYCGGLVSRLGLDLRTVYIGGGTPTVLSADQLCAVMRAVRESFDISAVSEYTVEAGRPDTVTREKLDVIRSFGASRVSVNPQTMDDAVLRRIGRRHKAEQTLEAAALVRQAGGLSLNMDLIAGLPGDTPAGFADSLSKVLACGPENVTVHTLAVKRAARVGSVGETGTSAQTAQEMLAHAEKTLRDAGFHPYYLYRQSRSVGNLENVGYARAGHEGLYNICMMEELHTVLGCGAGAVTKLVRDASHLTRVFNHKYPYEYISRFGELMERKSQVATFYAEPDAQNTAQ